jgi:hypothetical protein
MQIEQTCKNYRQGFGKDVVLRFLHHPIDAEKHNIPPGE